MTEQLQSYQQPQQSALTQVESSRAVQEVQAAIIVAKKFPRDQLAAMERIKVACQRPGLANAAVYQYARGGSDISGPSIRLAETIAREWGNIQYGIRELEQANGESTVEAFCWDVETNTRQTKIFQVPHSRYTKANGNKKLDDPRDIYELVANNGARRLRACILGIIPGDIVEDALAQCEETMRAKADTSPEAQKAIISKFEQYGVKKEQIEAKIQRKMDAITPANVVALRKMFASLKDGMSTAAEWFTMTEAPPKADFGKKPEKTAKVKEATDAADLWAYIDKNEIAESSALRWLEIEKREDLTNERAAKVNKDELLADLCS